MLGRVKGLFGSSGGNYAYVTARVKALKTHLLPEEEFPKLIARDEHEIARALQDGRYKEEIDELGSDHAGAILVERATRLHMGREFSRILGWCQGRPRDMVGHYLERFTVHNVKTVLRGARSGASREETEMALIPAGVIPMETWTQALGATSLDEAIDSLEGTGYTHVLGELKGQPPAEIENELDRRYYKHLLEAVPADSPANKAFLHYLRHEVDIVNLKLIFRAKHAGVEDYELVQGGLDVTAELARRIASAQWSEVASLVDETRHGEDLKAALATYVESRDLNPLVTALDQHLLKEADDFGHLYPLSVLPIIDYVLHKEWEVDRIRIIAFGKQAGLETEEIEQLVMV